MPSAVFSRNVALDTYEAPGFFTVPVEFQTEAGRAYVWQISHPEEELVLGWQNTGESGLTVYGNYYYVDEDGSFCACLPGFFSMTAKKAPHKITKAQRRLLPSGRVCKNSSEKTSDHAE